MVVAPSDSKDKPCLRAVFETRTCSRCLMTDARIIKPSTFSLYFAYSKDLVRSKIACSSSEASLTEIKTIFAIVLDVFEFFADNERLVDDGQTVGEDGCHGARHIASAEFVCAVFCENERTMLARGQSLARVVSVNLGVVFCDIRLQFLYIVVKYVYHFITDFVFAILLSIAQIEGLFYYFKSFKCLFYAYHDI